MPITFGDKALQIKYTIEEKVSLEEMVRQGEKAKKDLVEVNKKLEKYMQEYLGGLKDD